MNKFLKASTEIVKTGFAAKDLVGKVLYPLTAMRNFVKKILIKSVVLVIKQAINFATDGKSDNHIALRQLNAVGNPQCRYDRTAKEYQV